MPLRLISRNLSVVVSMVILLALLVLGTILACDRTISKQAENRHFRRIQDLPPREVAIVLGCSDKLRNGRSNLYFQYRIEAAAALYRAGKCETLIVSGDNSRPDYDEPARMKDALIGLGVPADRIQPDCAGFRTLDSIIRAKAVFGQEAFLVVSQPFHNERAIYIASQHDLDVVGFDARDVGKAGGFKTRLREGVARAKTLLDLHLLNTEPKFLGPVIGLHKRN